LDRFVTVPDSIDPVYAAPMTCALGTAYRSVVGRGGVEAGSRALVIDLGRVGIRALQIARATRALAVGRCTSKRIIDATQDLGLDARQAEESNNLEQVMDESDGEGSTR
jgi:D-arabinose 1-dehydrogenase-like Zn-dependent alcohol dehydrogenase